MERKKLEREECCDVLSKKRKTESSRNECSIDYVSHPPSLEHIVLVSMSIKLWTEPDVYEDVMEHSRSYGSEIRSTREIEAFHALEERVAQKIEGLCLPDIIKIKVSNVIRPIGLQLLKCFDLRDNEYCKFIDLFENGCSLYWTVEGIIDKRRVLVDLIENEKGGTNFCHLYELACKYCLEDYVFQLWEKVPHDRKTYFIDYRDEYEGYGYHIIDYWTSLIKNELPSLLGKFEKTDKRKIYSCNSSINQNMVTLSIFVRNAFSLRYFWSKLTAHEKELNLENWLIKIIQRYQTLNRRCEYQNYDVDTDILCFLLSHLKNQSHIFQTHSKIILKALFCYWPFQRFFLLTINLMLNYLKEDVYIDIITCIIRQITVGRTTGELFRKIWCGSSEELKKACLPVIVKTTNVINNLLIVDDLETICLLLNSLSADEKKKKVFYLIRSEEMRQILGQTKFSLLDSLALRTLSSESDVKHFKESLVQKYGERLYHDWILKNNFQAAEKMLHWNFETPEQIKNFKKNATFKIRIYTSLVCLGDYGVIDRFLNWCFESVEDINDFRQTYIRDSNACWELLVKLGSRYEDGWDLFEEFLKYSSYSSEMITDFKKLCLECVETLLEYSYFEFAKHILLWCLDTVEEIKKFKNKLFQSGGIMNLIWHDINYKYPDWNKVKKTLKWLSPLPRETVTSLKCDITDDAFTRSIDYKSRGKKRCFFHLLDNFVAAESSSDSDSNSSDDREFMEILNDAVENDDDTESNSDSRDVSTSDSSDRNQLCRMIADLTDSDIYCTDAEYYASVTENEDSASDDAFDTKF